MLRLVDRKRDQAVALDQQMIVGGSKEHGAGCRRLFVDGVADRQRTALLEHVGRPHRRPRRHVDDHQHGDRELGRERRQDVQQAVDGARGAADHHGAHRVVRELFARAGRGRRHASNPVPCGGDGAAF